MPRRSRPGSILHHRIVLRGGHKTRKVAPRDDGVLDTFQTDPRGKRPHPAGCSSLGQGVHTPRAAPISATANVRLSRDQGTRQHARGLGHALRAILAKTRSPPDKQPSSRATQLAPAPAATTASHDRTAQGCLGPVHAAGRAGVIDPPVDALLNASEGFAKCGQFQHHGYPIASTNRCAAQSLLYRDPSGRSRRPRSTPAIPKRKLPKAPPCPSLRMVGLDQNQKQA